MKKKSIITFLKLLVIAICFALLSRKLDFKEILTKLSQVHIVYLLPALLLILSEPFVMACKWNILLKQRGIRAGFLSIVRLIFVSNFLSLVFPTTLGADALRVYLLKKQKHSLTHATGSLLADRLLGVMALIVLSLAAMPLVWAYVADKRILILVIAVCCVLLAGILLAMSAFAARTCKAITDRLLGSTDSQGRIRLAARKIALLIENIHGSARGFMQTPRILFTVFLLNISVQVLRIAQIHFLFRSLGCPVPVIQEFAFVPIIILLALLPISFYGLGIKENAFVYLFSTIGIPSSISVSVSLFTYPLIAIALVPGAFFFSLGDRNSRSTAGKAEEQC